MARTAEIKLFGMKALRNTLEDLKKKATRQGVRNALRESAKILVKESQEQLDAVIDTKPKPQAAHPRKRKRYNVSLTTSFEARKMPSRVDSSLLYWWRGTGIKNAAKSGRIVITADDSYVKVHVFNDFRVKWFATGTKERHTKGSIEALSVSLKGRDAIKREQRRIRRGGHIGFKRVAHSGKGRATGKITATHFFTKAQTACRNRVFDELDKRLYEEVKKACDKYGVVVLSRQHL